MCTYPYVFRRHIPQQCIEYDPVLSRKKRIDPDEDTVAAEKLLAHLIRHIIGIDRGLRFNAERGHRLENAMKPIVLWRFRIPFWGIPWPQQCQLASFALGHVVLVSLFPHAQKLIACSSR